MATCVPFGFNFLEFTVSSISMPLSELRYDDSADYTVLCGDKIEVPFVEAKNAFVTTQTITEEKTDEPEDVQEEHHALLYAALVTMTSTKMRESPDENNEDALW